MSLPPLMPLEEAQTRLLDMAQPLASEIVPIESAAGRFLARPLLAKRTQPAADLSAMDGYAVRGEQPAGPWKVIGESAAGRPFEGTLGEGQAVRISTGALMPHGSGAVLLQENAVLEGSALRVVGENAATARHIRPAGLDFAEGDVLLAPGTRMGAAQIALALMSGNGEVAVHERPRLAIIDSGDELASDSAQIAPHQIPASNGAMIAALAAPYVMRSDRFGPVPDSLDALVESYEKADGCDVVVTSGGASVGDHDLVRPALERWGADIVFWRVALKPGKPLLVARKGATILLGLPGNPVSSYVTALLFLIPVLRRIGGSAQSLPIALRLPLAEALPPTGQRTEFVRAKIIERSVRPIAQRDSSALHALSRADALIRCDAGSSAREIGELVDTYLLENGGIA